MAKTNKPHTQIAYGVRIGMRPSNKPYLMLQSDGSGPALFDDPKRADEALAKFRAGTGSLVGKVVRVRLGYASCY